jgi:aromatic ring-opening dioxygenase catalytic subunit (LigB family)
MQPADEEPHELPNVAVLGSGSMYHSFDRMQGNKKTGEFDAALTQLLTDPSMSPAQRKEQLLKWFELPGARLYQPAKASEHFSPLLSVVAAAGYQPATAVVRYTCFGAPCTDFVWK